MERQPNTEYVLSLSYGKDSQACQAAIEQQGWPQDRIVHAEVWATDTVPADLPPMVEFKKKADAIIKERYGVEVEHVCAMRGAKEHLRTKILCPKNERKVHRELYRFPNGPRPMVSKAQAWT